MPDFLDEKRHEIAQRLKELTPLVAEYERLTAAAAALDGVAGTPAAASAARGQRTSTASGAGAAGRATAKAAANGGRTSAKSGARRGRPKGSGARGAQALQFVKDNPGITTAQIAEKMGIKQNYLYRLLPGLAERGLLTKDGRGWRATVPADALVG